MGSKSCLHVAWFKSVPFVLLQQCQEPAFSFLSTSQQFCCFRGVCRGFHLWLTGRAGYWLGEIGSSSYLFSNPVATTLLPAILETTLISVESSKGRMYILVLEKVAVSQRAWIPCEFPVIKYEKRFLPGFWKQHIGRKLLLNQQYSCWDMSSSQTGRTFDEDKDSLLHFWFSQNLI